MDSHTCINSFVPSDFRRKSYRFTLLGVRTPSGSAIIIVITLLGVMGLLLQGWWKCASMTYEIVGAREEWYTHFYMTDAVREVGIKKIVCLPIEKIKKEKEIWFDMSEEAHKCGGFFENIDNKKENDFCYAAKVVVYYREKKSCMNRPAGGIIPHWLIVKSILYKDDTEIFTLWCVLHRKNNVRKLGLEEDVFYVDHYTIGASI